MRLTVLSISLLAALLVPGPAFALAGVVEDPELEEPAEDLSGAVAAAGETAEAITEPVGDAADPVIEDVEDAADPVIEDVEDILSPEPDDSPSEPTDPDPTEPTEPEPPEQDDPEAREPDAGSERHASPQAARPRETATDGPTEPATAGDRDAAAGIGAQPGGPEPPPRLEPAAAPAGPTLGRELDLAARSDTRAPQEGSWWHRAGRGLSGAAETLSFPLLLVVAVALFLLVQGRIDAREPKLSSPADEQRAFS